MIFEERVMVSFSGRGLAWALGLAALMAAGDAMADQVRTQQRPSSRA